MAEEAGEAGQPGPSSWTPRLKTVLGLCFCANLLCVLVRIDVSIAAPLIIREFGWDQARMGAVLSAFFAGYVLLMIPGGILADRFGPRTTLAWGVGLWSLSSIATGYCEQFWSLTLWRFLTGAAQGVNFPCITSLIAGRVPVRDRAKAQGFVLSGMVVASVVGLPAGAWIAKAAGWPAVFFCFGAAGLLWLVPWVRCAPLGGPSGRPARERPPWRTLLTHRAALGLTLSYFCHNYGSYFLLAWLPTYLIQVHGLSVSAMGFAAALPSVASIVTMNASGWFGDHLLRTGHSRDFARKLTLCTGMAGSGALLLTLLWARTPMAAVGLITLSAAARSLATPSYWTLSMDMAPRHSGILSSIMNTSGNVAGIVAPALTGYLVARMAGWEASITLAGVVSLLGAAIAAPTVSASELA